MIECLARDCELSYKDEMGLVQSYEVIDNENILMKEINNALECVRIRRQETCGFTGNLRPAAQYWRIPLGSVRRLVYIVQRDFAFDILIEAVPRKRKWKQLCGRELG